MRRNRAVEDSRMMIRMALGLLIILVPLQIYLGDLHGLNSANTNPQSLLRSKASTPPRSLRR